MPLLPLPCMVSSFNTFINKATNYNWPCIIIYFPSSSLCNIWDVINFFISIFFFQISFTTCVKLLMASIIVDEPMDNHLFFLFNFLLGFPCTLCNLHAQVLGLSKLTNGVVLTFALSSPNTKVCFSWLLSIQGVWKSSSSLTFTTSILEFITYTPWSMALGMPFILIILEKMLSKPSNHGQSDGGAPITSVFFFSIL